jgi:hypothetical protein
LSPLSLSRSPAAAGERITSLTVGDPVVGDVQWIKSTSSLRSDGTFLFFAFAHPRADGLGKNKKAPVLTNKCF